MLRKKRSPLRIVLFILNSLLVIALLCFIWGNSLLNRTQSSQESLAVLELLRPFLERFLDPSHVTEHLVRKLAHFTEFCALGFLSTTWRGQLGKRRPTPILLNALFGLGCALIDEGIQIFSDRGNQLSDVLLDYCGFFTGFLLALAVLSILRWICRRTAQRR